MSIETSRLAAPPGACDCHMHIYEDRFPLAATATFKPPHAPPSAYRDVQRNLGITRAIVVQPTGYGFDNRCTLEGMAALGPGARGIAVVRPEVAEAELLRLTDAGIRGVRFHMQPGGVLPWDALEGLAAKVLPFGWHVQLQLDGRDLPEHEARLAKLPCRLVVDHVGKFGQPGTTPEHAGFKALLRLLDSGNCWVKLSAPYETSKVGPPHYDDVRPLARALAKANPERCVWASNWPHPNQKTVPSTAAMLDLLLDWVDDTATRTRILVDNPVELYGF
ncbi:MAG TPA: amidohydrolase family protein [Casimicrobiaceae bacterium]|nr:amidohydrolase family protein [Casimicrobiaceae bacterium]